MTKDLNYADDEKIRLLQWLLAHATPADAIASELTFGNERNRADLALVSETRLSAFEIKGPRDSIGTLANQIAAYLDAFNAVSVAVAPRHLAATRILLPRQVGLLSLEPEIKWLRAPYVRKHLSKTSAALWLQRKDFSAELAKQSKSLHELRAIAAEKYDAPALSALAYKSVLNRVLPRFLAFKSELGERLTLDDVRMLTLPAAVR